MNVNVLVILTKNTSISGFLDLHVSLNELLKNIIINNGHVCILFISRPLLA